jgi:hypothetical protein
MSRSSSSLWVDNGSTSLSGSDSHLTVEAILHAETQSAHYYTDVGFEVFTAVTMKDAVFWDVAPCRSCEMNRRFGGTYCLHLQGRKIHEQGTSMSRLQQSQS